MQIVQYITNHDKHNIFKNISFYESYIMYIGSEQSRLQWIFLGHLTIGDFKVGKIFKQNCEQKTHRFELNEEFQFTDMRIVSRMQEELSKEQISAVKVPSSHFEISLGLRYV